MCLVELQKEFIKNVNPVSARMKGQTANEENQECEQHQSSEDERSPIDTIVEKYTKAVKENAKIKVRGEHQSKQMWI